MRSWLKLGAFFLVSLALGLVVVVGVLSRKQAHALIYNPLEHRGPPETTPADFGLDYRAVTVTSEDGLRLQGWYLPTQNGAVVLAQHGLRGSRVGMLEEAQMLHHHGYGVLMTSVRAHDQSEGELISFGYHEMKDWQAWYEFLLAQEDVDPERIGALGNSMGATQAIQFASQNEGIKAVVAHSPYSSIDDTAAVSVRALTGLPSFPFAPLMLFWAEQEIGVDSAEIDAKLWIPKLSPRPVLIIQGGLDNVVSPQSGELLFEAAGEPRELWFEPMVGHAAFDTELPHEYERRVIGFFDQHLLNK